MVGNRAAAGKGRKLLYTAAIVQIFLDNVTTLSCMGRSQEKKQITGGISLAWLGLVAELTDETLCLTVF